MVKNLDRSLLVFVLICFLVALLGAWLMAKTTEWGPWAFSDSATYVSAARNFSRGLGFVIVNSNGSQTHVTEFPPFYSIFLSFFLGNGDDPNHSLRWVNVSLYIIFLIVFGVILYITTVSNLASLAGMLFCATSPVLIEIFSGVMSETLFLPLLCTMLMLVLIYFRNGKLSVLILLTAFSCLLPITRYAGSLFVVVLALAILLFSDGSFLTRLRKTLIYASTALLPVSIWLMRLYLSFNKVGGKSLKIDLSLLQSLLQSFAAEFNVIRTWLPYYGVYSTPPIDQIIQWGFFLVFLALIISLLIRYRAKSDMRSMDLKKFLFYISIINLCAYLAFIALTHSITIPQIDIIDRMLAPVIPFFVIIFALAIEKQAANRKSVSLIILVLISLAMLRFNYMRTLSYANEMQANGHGYSARQYQESGIIREIQAIPAEQRMVSNAASFVLYYTNRFPIQIDQFANRTFGKHNGYGEKWVREKGAPLILLYPEFRNYYGETADQLLATITNGLEARYRDEVGGIYYYPSSGLIQP